jgi:hypothetical protein
MWVVAIVTLLAYAPAMSNDFISWDDADTIYNNPRLNPAGIEKNAWYWAHPENGEYLPLTRSVWALLVPIARLARPDERGITLNPWIYHGAGVIAHAISALLVYLILARMLRIGQRVGDDLRVPRPGHGKPCPPAADTACGGQAVAPRHHQPKHDIEPSPPRTWPAAAGALLFAIHPLQVEAVAWASGLKDLLFGLFALAAILAYLCYACGHDLRRGPERGGGHGPRPDPLPEGERVSIPRTAAHRVDAGATRLFYILGLLALLASILSKPMGVITPLPVALLGWRLCRRPLLRVLLELVPWFALSLTFGLLARHWMPATAIPTVAFWQRPFVAADSLAFYTFKLVWPAELAIDYGRTPLAVMASLWGYVTWLVPAAIAALLWRIRRSHPLPGLGAAVFVLVALPILGLTPHMFQYYSTVADHYVYLPMLGVAMAAAYGLSLLRGRTSAVAAGSILAVLGIRTICQTANWNDNETFWGHALGVNSRSYTSMVWLARDEMARGTGDGGKTLLSRALQLNPDYLPTHQALVEYYTAHRQIDPAITHLRRGLEIMETFPDSQRPDLAPQYVSLAELLLARGRPAEALAAAEKARRINPGNPSIPAMIERIRAATTRPTTMPGNRQ